MSSQAKNVLSTLTRSIPKLIREDLPYVEPRISVLGVRRSGKSTFVGCLHVKLVDMALKGLLRYRVHEYMPFGLDDSTKVSMQRQSAAELRAGKFPIPTPQDTAFEADMSIRFSKRFAGEKVVHLPIIDVAGETVAESIEAISSGQWETAGTSLNPIARELYDKIYRATGIVLILSAASVTPLEAQPENLFYIADVNLSHIVERVFDYKENHAKHGAIPVKSMCVVLTKYDAVADRLRLSGMDLTTDAGRDKFMSTHFPETYSMLGWFGLNKCLFLPTWVDLQYDSKGQVMWNEPDEWRTQRTPMIMVDRRANRPSYSEPSYERFVLWLKENWGN